MADQEQTKTKQDRFKEDIGIDFRLRTIEHAARILEIYGRNARTRAAWRRIIRTLKTLGIEPDDTMKDRAVKIRCAQDTPGGAKAYKQLREDLKLMDVDPATHEWNGILLGWRPNKLIKPKSPKDNINDDKIIAAINTGKKDRALCEELDTRKVKPRESWPKSLWPGCYAAAWASKTRTPNWKRLIKTYLDNIKRDYPDYIRK